MERGDNFSAIYAFKRNYEKGKTKLWHNQELVDWSDQLYRDILMVESTYLLRDIKVP